METELFQLRNAFFGKGLVFLVAIETAELVQEIVRCLSNENISSVFFFSSSSFPVVSFSFSPAFKKNFR